MKKYVCKLLLAVLIMIQIGYTIFAFENWKEGAHEDEVLNYGLSNSYYRMAGNEELIRKGEWVSGEEAQKYLTVQNGERFAYGSVYDNCTYNVYPPFYYMILHTVSSFFPDRFSWWYGFMINLVCLAGTQIFLFLATRKIAKSEWLALAACLLYAGGKGALGAFTFIGQYGLLTMFCMGFTYFAACVYAGGEAGGKFSRKHLAATVICAELAFWTHYQGVLYVGVFTACFCLYLLFRKKLRQMFMLGVSMLGALAVFAILWPASMRHLALAGQTEEFAFSPAVQIRILLSYLFEYNYGFKTGYFPTAFWNIALPLIGAGLVAAVALLLPFRDEAWFGRLMRKLRDTGVSVMRFLKNADYIPAFGIAGCLALYEQTAHGVDVYLAGTFAVRYICVTIPVIAMAVVIFFQKVLGIFRKGKVRAEFVIVCLICIALGRVWFTARYPYHLPQIGEIPDLCEETAGRNVLVVELSPKFHTAETAFVLPWIYKADGICVVPAALLGDCAATGAFSDRKIDYLLVDMRIFQLTDEDMRNVEQNLGVTIQGDPEEKSSLDCVEKIREITRNAPYEIRAIRIGQRANYYVIRFE